MFKALSLLMLAFAVSVNADEKKVAFITGASSGIGYSVAKYLAANGMRVVLTARREDKLKAAVEEIEAAGGEAMAVKLDVTIDQDHIDAYKAAADAYGGIDYVLINAGYEGQITPLVDLDISEVQKVFDINCVGMMRSIKFGLPYVQKRQGAMASISSIAANLHRDFHRAVGDGFMAYSMTKAATDMMSRNAAAYAAQGVRFYNIKPAVFISEMVKRIAGTEKEEELDQFSQVNPFFKGLPGDPVTIGKMALAMFDGSTKFQPGTNIIIDNDAAFDSHHFYKTLELDNGVPTEAFLKTVMLGLDGGEYKCSTPNTCKWYNGEAGPLAEKKEL